MKRFSKISRYWRTIIILLSLALLLSVTAFFPAACDWYSDHIYGFISAGFGHVTALLPFILGEWLIYLGILLVFLSVIFLVLLIFLRKKTKYRKFCKGWFKTILMIIVCVVFVYVPNWVIPFFGRVMGQDNSGKRTDFNAKELTAVYSHIITELNNAAEEIEIAPDGTVRFYTDEEALPLISEAMNGISDEYPRLAGYYPPVKTAFCSDILERMNIGGFTLPYTMEPLRNKYLAPSFLPILCAHELSHHKGFYKENEANFASQLALSKSSDPLLRFSAYDDMRRWFEPEWQETTDNLFEELKASGAINPPELPPPHEGMTDAEIAQFREALEESMRIATEILGGYPPALSDRYYQIINTAQGIEQQIYEEDSHPIDDMPAVNEFIHETADTGWKIQSELLQENCYDGVVLLLLQYYDGILF